MKFFVIRIKRNIITIIFLLFTIGLVIFSKGNLSAAKSGLSLWATAVVPSLFPFFIATELLGYTNLIPKLGKIFEKIMKPIFNVPGEGSYAFIMGLISGYPVGAKIVSNFRQEGICTKEEAERLVSFTNNSGPLFIIGTVGCMLFGDTRTGVLLLLTHILACISVGFVMSFWKKNSKNSHHCSKKINSKKQAVTFSNLGEIISTSITNSISTILMIGGFVVIFSVVISILNQTHITSFFGNAISPILQLFNIENPSQVGSSIFSGILELTNGISNLSNLHIKSLSQSICISSFLLGFGGLSVLLQVYSIISKTDISIFPYFIGKVLHGIFAIIYTGILLSFDFFNLDLALLTSILHIC